MITLTPEQQQDVARRFQGLLTPGKAATRYRSNTHALRNHPVYQELIALGEPVVPLILAELEREPSVSWMTVLVGITGEDPVPPNVDNGWCVTRHRRAFPVTLPGRHSSSGKS